jgi:lipid-A-disaccharide synthase
LAEILIVAGETSGDIHAAAVAASLRQRLPGHDLVGIGSSRMEGAGVRLIERSENLAALGLVEVVKHVPHHLELLRQLESRVRSGHVDLVILIDYPGFNLRVAAAARRAGVPVLYYITPQIWAWGARRARKIARYVTRAAVILPFEESLLRSHGVDAQFVGHPLLDHARTAPDRGAARRSLDLDDESPVLAIFPGSRRQEIDRHLDAFVATARLVSGTTRGLKVIVSGAPSVEIDEERCPFPIIRERSFTVLRAADAALCKSGTTTLEAAVAGCPHIIAYSTNPITYAVAKRVVRITRIGLVNIVADREVVPEFVQGSMQPQAMAAALAPLLDHESAERTQMVDALADVRRKLGEPGAADRVAVMAADMVTGRVPAVS